MKTDSTYYIDLISKYFFGEASPEEIHAIEEWIDVDEENKKIFEEYKNIWQNFERAEIESSMDVDSEWEEIIEKLNFEVLPNIKVVPLNSSVKKRSLIKVLMRYAAVLLLFNVVGYYIYTYINKPETVQIIASNQILDEKLPDGSNITLNKGTSIEYKKDFKKRALVLKGEAYFDVKHDKSSPFVITAEDLRVEVLGTSFYVNTNNSNGKVEVILKSGRVAVYYASSPESKVILEPGEKVEMSKMQEPSNQGVKTVFTNENFMSWKTKKICFNDEPLIKIVEVLNKVYNVNIRLENAHLNSLKVTATFDNQTLDAVLDVIQATVDVTVKRNGDIIEIGKEKQNVRIQK